MNIIAQGIEQQIAQAQRTIRTEKKANVPAGYKICNTCQRCLSKDKFGIYRRAKDGLNPMCKECVNKARRESRATPEGKAKANEASRKNRATPEGRAKHKKVMQERRATPEGRAKSREATHKNRATPEGRAKANEASLAWQKKYPERNNAKRQRYYAQKMKALPPWANTLEEIRENEALNLEARVLEKMDGKQRHLDHIIPLQSDIVCGLHCVDNLQIMLGAENIRKSNHFSQDDAVAPNPFYYRRQK